MRITQRQVALGMQIMIMIGLVGIAFYQVISGSPPFAIATNILGVFLAAALYVAYLRSWRYAAPAIMLLSIVLSSFVPPLPSTWNAVQRHLDGPRAARGSAPPPQRLAANRFDQVLTTGLPVVVPRPGHQFSDEDLSE